MLTLIWAMPAMHAQEHEKSSRPPAGTRDSLSKRIEGKDVQGADSKQNLPSKAARVTLADGQLTVTAQNSDLAQILDRVSRLSGMKVSGSGVDAHVFGVYGPGNPQSVLTKLLAGSGYNFMMVGRTAVGAPRKLLLMARSDAPAPTPPAVRPTASQPVAPGENTQQGQETNPAESSTPDQEPLGPGALAHVPPSEQQANQESPQVRLQQHLQQLQQQYQERQQQQPQ